jgi:hypothetical protein
MADPLSFALVKLILSTRAVDGVLTLADRVRESMEADPGRVFDTVREAMAKRQVLEVGESTAVTEGVLPAQSPAVDALLNLYGEPANTGVVYVLYDKSGTGKSSAGIALLKHFHTFPTTEKKIKGFMMSSDTTEDLYVSSMAKLLKASKVEGWLNALLLAMDQPLGETPSLLILDDFNSLGSESRNVDFIKRLYQLMNPMINKKNMFVVVMTQNEDVANTLCGCNGGQRVRPLKGFYTGTDLTKPVWTLSRWSRTLLVEAIKYEYHKQLGDKDENDDFFSFVEEGMTPLQVSMGAKAAFAAAADHEKPSSPKRRKTTNK